jgi:Glycosyl transferase family 11
MSTTVLPRTVEICGLYQTYIYADFLDQSLRRLLAFRPTVSKAAKRFLDNSRPSSWLPESYTRVGLHIRRGDFTRHDWRDVGLTVVDASFVHQVVDYFIMRYDRVQFVVATDDKYWTSTVFIEKFRGSADTEAAAEADERRQFSNESSRGSSIYI